jgi:cellobiose phosphorylase
MLVKEKERLVLVLDPPFEGGQHNPGYIKAYPPGVRENGGQYTHAATWLGFAHARAGDGFGAERIFRMLNPILHATSANDADHYRVEPYALAGDVYGGKAPLIGRGGWTWYTGAAAWMWRLGVEAILGLRKEEGGLRVDPSIPPQWPGFEATVRIGAQECHVVVDNAKGSGHGVASVTLDGVAVASPFVKLGTGSSRRELRIVLGAVAKAAE